MKSFHGQPKHAFLTYWGASLLGHLCLYNCGPQSDPTANITFLLLICPWSERISEMCNFSVSWAWAHSITYWDSGKVNVCKAHYKITEASAEWIHKAIFSVLAVFAAWIWPVQNCRLAMPQERLSRTQPHYHPPPNSCNAKYLFGGSRFRKHYTNYGSTTAGYMLKHKSVWLVTPRVTRGSPDREARGQSFMCYPRNPRNINLFVRVPDREDRWPRRPEKVLCAKVLCAFSAP